MNPEDQQLINDAVLALNEAIARVYRRNPDGSLHIRPGVNFSVGSYAEVYVEVTTGVVKIEGTRPRVDLDDDIPF